MIVLGLIEQFQLCHTRINNCVLHECMDLYVNKIFIHTKHTHIPILKPGDSIPVFQQNCIFCIF